MQRRVLKLSHSIILILFFLAVALGLLARVLPWTGFRIATKPLPLVFLLLSVPWESRYGRLIGIGIATSLAGDVLMETPLMPLGILAFMAANIVYVAAFTGKSRKRAFMPCAVSYLYGTAGVFLLMPYLGDMLVPIIVYALVVTTMLWRAWAQGGLGKKEGRAFIGAILFVLSDSILAYKMFVGKFPFASFILMSAYWAGQYLIFSSASRPSAVKEGAAAAELARDDEALEA